ncbi:hypothetical protein C3B58_18240 [Lactonifactor longoviformis]|uniref:SipW-cognate class signal peptide n=1 Tax=Lactonifactor longoviformis DSM 17459 TaxID=1122155 RepID=A0A1M5BLU6_9CLOT|nr:hypothetical protein [Lactonifactor longoviformis]POP31045.1 hypothetical protein C3B58_18240 [Lactonifactor longoviformis]SHF43395.1 hypothetical protein SAMN02745158_03711 [Lactonifactor longoviformis DSM 17459]
MKRKSQASRLGVLALALTLVTTCLTGGTMAKYVTEVTGNAKATVAAWSFKVNDEKTTMTEIDLGSTANRTAYAAEDIMEGVIAPGTSGSFDIVIDGSGSEVGVDYKLKIAAADGTILPSDLTFTTDNDTSGTPDSYTLNNELTGTIDYADGDTAMKKTITVKWTWAFGEDDTKDSNDNTYADKDWTLNITATGTQAEPTATVTP